MNRVRVLHVVHKMDRAGMETWLMHVMRHVDHERVQMDFLVHTAEPGAYDAEIRRLGGKVIVCDGARHPLRYARNFLRALKEHGPYNVVHSHLHYFSGLPMLLARVSGVPTRIAHSHLDTSLEDHAAGVPRQLYIRAMRSLIRTQGTAWLSTSDVAADALFGTSWRQQERVRTLYCGVDLAPFERAAERPSARAEFGIPPDALVIGHVGRFDDQKNHRFLIDAFAALHRILPDARLLLLGDGALRPTIERQVKQLELVGHVIFAGSRNDVPSVLAGVVDVFAFPSKYEGLGVALIEAQVAGIPCVVSTAVPKEAVRVDSLVTRVSLEAGEMAWARALTGSGQEAKSIGRHSRVGAFSGTAFDIRQCVHDLVSIYCSPTPHRPTRSVGVEDRETHPS